MTVEHNMAKGQKGASHGVALFTNISASILLAALIGLGVYVNVNKIIVSNGRSDGYKIINLNTTSWNVACTIVGTAVGILASVAFSSQDDTITRREMATPRGVVAMFLRPLTVKRGAEQVFHLQLPLERTLLVILTITTALTSAAVVALFGVRQITDQVVNPAPSFPLAALNGTFFESGRGGGSGVFPIGSPVNNPQISQLTGFLYRAAYIKGLKERDDYNAFNTYVTYLPEQGPIGDTIYENLNSGGIGLNVSSYLQYSGQPDGFQMPARFEFDALDATVFGTHVNVSCRNASADYTVNSVSVDIGQVYVVAVGKTGGGPNITMFNDLAGYGSLRSLVVGSAVTIDQDTGEPLHTLAIPTFGLHTAFVLECSYSGREYLADVSVQSPVSPLHVDREVEQGPILGPYVKQEIANVTHSLLGATGGNLARGFIDADYNFDGESNDDMAAAVEIVVGQLGEAYFSLLRQQVERSNLYKGDTKDENGSILYMSVTIQRLGGAQFGWLAVLGVLLLGTLLGTIRTCVGGSGVRFEAQDAVKLLRSTLRDDSLRETTRIRYDDGVTVVKEEG